MFWTVLSFVAWAACSVPTYLLARRLWRRKGWSWTRGDRRLAMICFPLGGPAALLHVIVWMGFGAFFGDKREARW
ncbi:MAG TPA: hypothetical protein VMY35_02575 [Phycisphaerae bacterium]|nr:hypothetical protein [Phycisphaerae bacterium]